MLILLYKSLYKIHHFQKWGIFCLVHLLIFSLLEILMQTQNIIFVKFHQLPIIFTQNYAQSTLNRSVTSICGGVVTFLRISLDILSCCATALLIVDVDSQECVTAWRLHVVLLWSGHCTCDFAVCITRWEWPLRITYIQMIRATKKPCHDSSAALYDVVYRL